MSTFIQKVYARVWFDIKRHSSCKDGARHIFNMIQYSRYLSSDLKSIIDPVIQRNAYFAHPENILLTMITDPSPTTRELGFRRLVKAKQKTEESLRQFKVPKLNFDAKSYIDIISWSETSITFPPILENVSKEDLEACLMSDIGSVHLKFERYPCHTQSVERCVKAVTESASKVCGKKNREGLIATTIKSRKMMPKIETKQDFVPE